MDIDWTRIFGGQQAEESRELPVINDVTPKETSAWTEVEMMKRRTVWRPGFPKNFRKRTWNWASLEFDRHGCAAVPL